MSLAKSLLTAALETGDSLDACERALSTLARAWSDLRMLAAPVKLKRRAMGSVTGESRTTTGLAPIATAAEATARRAERRAIAGASEED